MAGHGDEGQPQREERSKQEERAERILDAASELIQRWGYKKTTIDDIARQAGVAKGTIYLHWKTREELFMALIMREQQRQAHAMEHALANDPEGVTLHGLAKFGTLAALNNPLLKAVTLRDSDVLGELTNTLLADADIAQQMAAFEKLFTYLRTQGLIRTDQTLAEQVHMLKAITVGYLLVDQYLPQEYHVSIESKGKLVEETVRRTFELRAQTSEEVQTTSTSFKEVIDSIDAYHHKETES